VPLRRGAVQPVPPDMLNGSGAQRFEVAA
jgi:hypothetical protein